MHAGWITNRYPPTFANVTNAKLISDNSSLIRQSQDRIGTGHKSVLANAHHVFSQFNVLKPAGQFGHQGFIAALIPAVTR